jgi:hypothetical protein
MGKAYKNFWSLNVDEAVVTGILRDETAKNIEVLMPINAQMKGIDLVLMNIESKETISIQVKGSKAYEPKKMESEEFGDGSGGWFFLHKDVIQEATADYFIFLIYVIEQSIKTGRRYLKPHTITIPAKEMGKLSMEHKALHETNGGGRYSYYLWVNPKKKKAFDFREKRQGHLYDLSEYLDKKGFEKMSEELRK